MESLLNDLVFETKTKMLDMLLWRQRITDS